MYYQCSGCMGPVIMCGRFTLVASNEELQSHFGLQQNAAFKPRYNIAPGEPIPVVRAKGQLGFLNWGFIPAWLKIDATHQGWINARSETVTEKAAFRQAFLKRRCLIPATGYYEWKALDAIKQPFHIHLEKNQIFAFAAIWEARQKEDGQMEETCAILTQAAEGDLARIHERMPLIITPDQYEQWLSPLKSQEKNLLSFINPLKSQSLKVYPVSTKVNLANFESLECIQALNN